jgi:hypothetical protein
VDAVSFPEGSIGETNLAAHRFPPQGEAVGMQRLCRGIALFGGKSRITRAEWRYCARVIVQLDEFRAEFGCVHGRLILN